jgi:hypothetical protein
MNLKHLFLPLTVCLAAFAVACGGGGSPAPTPPPTPVGFSNSSLSGQYAYEMSGEDLSGGFLARVGTFTADGNGNITAAIEDVNDAGSFSSPPIQFTGGTYTIGTDGRGTLTLTGGSLGGGLGLTIALISTSSGSAIQTDENATSSGSFDLQSASAFSLPSITGQYAFDLSGEDSSLAPLSVVGEFAANGGGGLTGGTSDINDGASAAPSGPVAIPANTFVMDPTYGSSSGRGTVTINGQTVAFYIVDGTRLKMLEEDTVAITVGDAFVQSGTIPTAASGLTGSFAFIDGGSAVKGDFGSIARVGSAAFNGGALASASLDDNNAGQYNKLTGDVGTYTIDSSGSGRGTFTFTDSSFGTFSYVFYLSSPTQAVLQETSVGLIGSGSMSAQPSSISGSSLTGNYAFNWSGVTIPSKGNIGFEEDFSGQYSLSSSGAIAGTVDFTELGSTSTPIFTGVPLSGTFTASGTGRNTYQTMVSPGGGAPSTTIDFAAYVAAGNNIYLVTTDSTRVTAGTASPQTTP